MDTIKEDKTNWKEFLPFGTVAIVILSVIKYYTYYSYYKIPIGEYLTLSDVGFTLISDFAMIIGLTCAGFIYTYLSNIIYKEDKREPEQVSTEEKAVNRKRTYWKILRAIGFLLLIPLLQVVFIRLTKTYHGRYWTYATIYLVATFIAVLFYFVKGINSREIKKKRFCFTVAIALGLLFSEMVMALGDIESVNDGKTYGTVVITNDTTFVSNPNLYYIGKTQEFAFLYNRKDSTGLSIPMSEIKSIKHTYHWRPNQK